MTSPASRLPFGGYAGLDPAEVIAPEEGRSCLSKEVLLEDSFGTEKTSQVSGHPQIRCITSVKKSDNQPVRILLTLKKIPWRWLAFAGLLLVLLYLAIETIPDRQTAHIEDLTPGERGIEELKIKHRAMNLQALGGVAIMVGLYLTWKRIKTTEDGQVTDRFTKAIELLANEDLSSRLGAIYSLERIAKDSEADHWPVMEILTTYIRQNSPWHRPDLQGADTQTTLPHLQEEPAMKPDIQAALTVVGRRHHIRSEAHSIDLSRADLSGAKLLPKANFANAHFVEANLHRANFSHSDLSHAKFNHAILLSTVLNGAKLDHADMITARLGGTPVKEASVKGLMVFVGDTAQLSGLTPEQKASLKLADWTSCSIPMSVVVGPPKSEPASKGKSGGKPKNTGS